ncbi:MAG: ACT domain-containing protein, partial [bacterium]|nr:ACT domain-containing protein [bacterium]
VEEVVADDVVKSVTFSDDFGILKLEGPEVGIEPGILAAVTSALKNAGINIKSVITAQTCINILLSRSVLEESLQLVRGLAIPAVDSVRGLGDISLIAVVGHGMLKRPGIAGRVFGAVSSCNINVVMISAGASNAAIYFFVHRNDRTRAVECIHKEFFA